jgi:cytochrome c-type biogenesis protein CcmH/NrfF
MKIFRLSVVALVLGLVLWFVCRRRRRSRHEILYI